MYELLFYKKPTSPGIRHQVFLRKYLLSKYKLKNLTLSLSSKGGRNNQGIITVRHRGFRNAKLYRNLHLKFWDFMDIPFSVYGIEYDSFRGSFLILTKSLNGIFCYRIAPNGFSFQDVFYNYSTIPMLFSKGSSIMLKYVPEGSSIYNVELYPQKGGQLAKSPGTFIFLLNKNTKENVAVCRFPSGKVCELSLYNYAQLGRTSNIHNNMLNIGKFGRNSYLGRRPHVRGVAMNPIDHPHGGGEGKKSKKVTPRSPWGKVCRYKKTSKKK